jgi:hypothetical protein
MLDDFLHATDLDDLLKARQNVSHLTVDETNRIKSIINEWQDQQSIANLLFHPTVIPAEFRIAAVDRALHSVEAPYFALAAVVGLQGTDPTEVPQHTRDKWQHVLLDMIQSESDVIAGRASTTMFSWFQEQDAGKVLSLYPVPDETASKNILSFALSLYGDLSTSEFDQRLTSFGLSTNARDAFNSRHAEYLSKTSTGQPGAGFMKCPLLCYIPNMSEVPASAPAKPWWKFW